MKNIVLSLIVFTGLIANSLSAQMTVVGRVTDADNQTPLVGATVAVVDANKGVQTDAKGNFELDNVSEGAILEFSFLGYEKYTFEVNKNTAKINISLKTSAMNLSEIVVTGFENRRKLNEIAGGVVVMKPAEIQRFSNADLQLTLNSIPGVRMEATNPGGSSRLSIRGSLLRSPFGIRGIKAYWNDLPLTDAGGATPYDVFEPTILGSMEILKGPSGSIYGAGNGGVILFNTAMPSINEKSIETGYSAGSFGLNRWNLIAKVGTNNARFQIGYVDQTYDGYRQQQSTYRKMLNMTGQIYTGEKGMLSLYAYTNRRNFDLPGAVTLAEYEKDPRQSLPFAVAGRTRLTSEANNAGVSYRHDFAKNLTGMAAFYVSYASTP
jgi:iron complex outermembrane receptor protein